MTENPIVVASQDEIWAEIESTSHMRHDTLSLAEGRLHLLTSTLNPGSPKEHSADYWRALAHVETLKKLNHFLADNPDRDGLNLLAIARNLFENFVWVKLMKANPEYGLVFYDQLLKQQRDNTTRLLEKVKAEISLFEEYEKIDSIDDKEVLSTANGAALSDEDISSIIERRKTLTQELDNRARRQFCIYVHQAKFNGYSYQIFLLKQKEIPKLELQLQQIDQAAALLEKERPLLLSPHGITLCSGRWNWKERAKEAGREHQYNFLYSYTSKLLHSTPLNLVTEKSLSPSESIVLTDYIYVTALDIIDHIRETVFVGVPDIHLVRLT